MKPTSITVIVSTYNQPAALNYILTELGKQSRNPDEVIVADDGSGQETNEVVKKHQPLLGARLRHVWHADQGFRKTTILNKAISEASSSYIIFLDGDCVPTRQFVKDHAVLAQEGNFVQGRRAFIAETAVDDYLNGRVSLIRLALSGQLSGLFKAIRLPYPVIRINQGQRGLIGCNLAIWRADLLAINGFDESYAGWGMEDSDLCSRLYHLGRQRKLVHGRALVYHLNHPIASRDQVQNNQARLARVLATRAVRCVQGLDPSSP